MGLAQSCRDECWPGQGMEIKLRAVTNDADNTLLKFMRKARREVSVR